MKNCFGFSFAVIIALLLMAVLFTSSCGLQKEIVPNPDAVPYDIVTATLSEHPDKIKVETVLYSEAENELERLDDYYATLYLGSGSDDIDLGKFESYCVVSVPAGSASEIGILKVKDTADIDAIIALVKAHFTRIVGNFSSYIEKEAEIARNAEIRVAGNYIYYVATSDKDPIFNTIEALLTAETAG